MKKSLKFLIPVFLIASVGIYFYLYQDHRDISSEKPDFSITLTTLEKEFKANETKATQKYLDKTITIYGKLTTLDLLGKGIVLDNKIYATFVTLNDTTIKLGEQISIKGRFLGFDELLGEFKLDQISVQP